MPSPPTTNAALSATAGGAPQLSEREREMLGHLAAGRSIKQIASAMSISTNTVRGHGRRLAQKFGVDHRHEAVRRARDLQML